MPGNKDCSVQQRTGGRIKSNTTAFCRRLLSCLSLLSLAACAVSGGGGGYQPRLVSTHLAKKIVRHGNVYSLYLGGRLVDTITFTKTDTAINTLPDGKSYVDQVTNAIIPSLKKSVSPLSAGGCGGGGGGHEGILQRIAIDKLSLQSANDGYSAAILWLIAAYGGGILADLASGGFAQLLAVFGQGAAIMNFKAASEALAAAKAQLAMDQQNAILQGCHM